MKHLLIILSILLLSSPVIGNSHKGETLYLWETSSSFLWKGFGEKGTHNVYKGDVENGEPNGVGIMTNTDGSKYVGEWKNGKRHGQGTFTWSDGDRYLGEWKNGKKHGKGKLTLNSIGVDKFVGEWKNGETWNVKGYNKNGHIFIRFVNGVLQK